MQDARNIERARADADGVDNWDTLRRGNLGFSSNWRGEIVNSRLHYKISRQKR
jgi:hypothetical protein